MKAIGSSHDDEPDSNLWGLSQGDKSIISEIDKHKQKPEPESSLLHQNISTTRYTPPPLNIHL